MSTAESIDLAAATEHLQRTGQVQLVADWANSRAHSLHLAEGLSAEDQQVQSMPDASPTKWHLAHTTWFYETFILKPFAADYQAFDSGYGYLFNSYYEAAGARHPRPQRGLLTRPTLAQVHAYRDHVDRTLAALIGGAGVHPEVLRRVRLGINHEQQHQELMLSDIQHAFSLNPLKPAYQSRWPGPPARREPPQWRRLTAGMAEIGHHGVQFAFDNESPRHPVLIGEVEIASALVSERDWLTFIEAGGYRDPQWWMADGWAQVQKEGWEAPLYWQQRERQWRVFDLSGERELIAERPVAHVSWYEADAYARWSNARLPTEQEWECAASEPALSEQLEQLQTALWQWTSSAYAAYPGFRPSPGALGEYNGKFMCNQFVLRGGAHATPANHTRVSYRNFYYPHQRWQFAGVRLARDAQNRGD
ncbi:MAG: ergothioneine biosynthesis protein EgtB [Xanthomonadales bacterium]|nr:ergothioneine biosynthesis protein EgtB [Xanthomonadales bacterium]